MCLLRASYHMLHQTSSYASVLHRRNDGDRTHAGNVRILTKKVAPDDSPVHFGHDGRDVLTGEQGREEFDGNGRVGEIKREMMLLGYGLKGFVIDRATGFSIGRATIS